MKRTLLIILPTLFLVGCAGTGSVIEVKPDQEAVTVFVTRVSDGDTIGIRRPVRSLLGGKVKDITRVRYIGIDTPERDEPFYKAARELNKALVYKRHVVLEFDKGRTDQYARLLAYVYVKNPPARKRTAVSPDIELDIENSVNAELVRRGYAKASKVEPNVKHAGLFQQLELEAKEQKIGIWSIDVPGQQPAEEPGQVDPPAEYKFVASKDSEVFHVPSCSSAKRITGEKVCFQTYKAAVEFRRGCKRCNPKDK